MSNKFLIHRCKNGHHYINKEICPYCDEASQNTFEYRQGDCIHCGQLCPEYAYACNDFKPIKIHDFSGKVKKI